MKNKEVEKIIKNSIKIDNLDFFDKLPEVKDKKNYNYKR